jgi:ribonuclease P protein component
LTLRRASPIPARSFAPAFVGAHPVLEPSSEADLPTVQARAQAPPRLSFAHGHQERPEGDRPPARQGPQAPDRLSTPAGGEAVIERLKKRPDFLAVAKAKACAAGAVSTQARDRADGTALIRLGFTATRRIGGAVTRNRAKRRLREAARLLAPLHARPGCDYVFIARQGTATRPWARLLDDMRTTLQRLAADL